MSVLTQLAQSNLAARLACIVLLAALAGIATQAVLKVAYGAPAPAAIPAAMVEASKPMPLWLGSPATAVTAPSDIKLLGVVAQGASGMALIQQTGKRPQTLRVGQRLADGTLLKSVSGKQATLVHNDIIKTLTLDTVSGKSGSTAVNTVIPAVPMPDASTQISQQMQQLQQAVANESQASQSAANADASPLKKRLSARP